MATSASTIPAPSPFKMGGDIAADWERFRSEWENYEIAADLTDVPDKKRAAVFLACVGSTAYGIFRTFQFERADDRSDVTKIIEAFERHSNVKLSTKRIVLATRELSKPTFARRDIFA